MTVEVERASAPIERVTIRTASRCLELEHESQRMPFLGLANIASPYGASLGMAIPRADLIEFCKAALEMFGE